MRNRVSAIVLALVALSVAPAFAQFQQGDDRGAELGQTRVQRWQAGVTVEALGGSCRGIVATIPVPVDWPEQSVTIVEEDVSRQARINQQRHEKTVPQLVINIHSLPSGQEANAILVYEVTRRIQKPPVDTSIYQICEDRDLPRELRIYLAPSLPHIDSRDRKIRELGDTIGAGEANAWDRVEAIFDHVRDNVEFTKGAMKGSTKALADGKGNHEDLCFAFIAICRAAGIPARTVWVPTHCYPEFYLIDDEGNGHWFPCQVAGPREFGSISESRPILQKGDLFRDPRDRRKTHRYLPETLNGSGGRPKVRFIRQLLPD